MIRRLARRFGQIGRLGAFAVVGAAVAVAVGVGGARPAAAADGERIRSFDATVVVVGDGSIRVTERIAYDFGGGERRGIFRFLPDRYRCRGDAVGPGCPEGQERRTPIDLVTVTRDGVAEPWATEHEDPNLVVRIGDPDRTLTGAHTYELTYTVRGVFNAVEGGGSVLPWNVTGNGWTVPVDAATVTLDGPAPTRLVCTSGPAGAADPCAGDALSPRVEALAPGEGMTITVAFAPGVIAVPEPILFQPQTLKRAFSLNAGAGMLGAATAVAGAGVTALVARRGRDRRFVGGPVEVAMGRAGQPDEPRPLFEKLPEVMEYTPPNGVRPGQIGSLIDERVQHRDITATIVDLAVRRYLTITELDDDWRIGRGAKAPDDALRPYERLLLDELLGGAETVDLGSLKHEWSAKYGQVRSAMYDDMVANGWYKSRPDASRRVGMATAFALQFGGTGLTGGLAARTTVALAGLPLVAAGVATMVVARQAGARTALGTAMTARGRGFRRLIETPTQQEMARFAERNDVFMEYLPYAIAFGCASQWAKRFEALGVAPPSTAGWYVPLPRSAGGGGDGGWDRIATSMAGFGLAAAATLAAPAASGASSGSGGGGGFSSGGGFGGGGGGSW